MNGFLNILKPTGCTSSDVVGIVKKLLGEKCVGHFGTLDPMGAGVLPIAIGKATRLFDILSEKQKTYRAIFSFGWQTDTVDSDGHITSENNRIPSEQEIENALPKFVGNILQIPPDYSSIKLNGQHAYALARAGKEVNIKARKVNIYSFKLIEKISERAYLFEVVCSTGTYIRSLCTDLALDLGTTAVMTAIVRTNVGAFAIENATTIDDLKNGNYKILPADYPLEHLKSITVSEEQIIKLRQGQSLFGVLKESDEPVKIMCNGNLMGIGEFSGIKLGLKINIF